MNTFTSASTSPARSLLQRLDEALLSIRYHATYSGVTLVLGGATLSMHRLADRRAALTRPCFGVLLKQTLLLRRRDLDNVMNGVYPRSLLFDFPWREYYWRRLRDGVREGALNWRRRKRRARRELPITSEALPAYYRRTFHWQTDGWLSDHSARMYDPSVELLLGGTANMMRRMSLPHLAAAIAEKRAPRILDVACGTGTYLKQLSIAFPHAELAGVDLSPFYLDYARAWVKDPRVSWVRANAEKMPFADGHFDAVVSTFLFHELPKAVRRQVLSEMCRVTAPGGKIILVDSGQRGDVREFDEIRHQFHRLYHEPYYKSYLVDDLATLMTHTGLSVISNEVHFLSKVVVGEKPA